ncbi:MAG: ABC transporter permease, partial [Ruthenibacterium sp.]
MGKKIVKSLNTYRAYLLVAVMLFLGIFAKNFYTMYNMKSILDSTLLYTFMGVGFTLCMIAGHMDLSVGAMANLGAVVTMGMHTLYGLNWGASIIIATIVATLAGAFNGLMIAKAKIHSFIATLGMQFVLRGVMYIFCNGAEISDKGDFAFADVLNRWLKPFPISPKVIAALIMVISVTLVMRYTRFGRNIYMIGGNAETAWLAGINRDRYTILIFAFSGFTCALGGALFAIAQSSALPNLGEKGISPLLVALAATIIGGTNTDGGRGSVWSTFIAIVGLMAMSNVLTVLVGKYEVQILANGLVLAACVFYETITAYYNNKKIG